MDIINFIHNETPSSEIDGKICSKALLLDPSFEGKVLDISFHEGGRWVVEEIEAIDLDDECALRARISTSEEKLMDLKACSLWPVSALSHMQLIHQLKHALMEKFPQPNEDDNSDMSPTAASIWAEDEIMKVNLRDPFAIADRISIAADKLSSEENCRMWPGSAYAHRKVVTDLMVFLRRSRGTLH